ncbi:hypothetical protein FHT00_000141 [Sphingomonas insulae]|nr:hypothetical protein [Sphingomonas insulae]
MHERCIGQTPRQSNDVELDWFSEQGGAILFVTAESFWNPLRGGTIRSSISPCPCRLVDPGTDPG